ncbi:hypothetical protein C9E82_13305 [Paracoccus siganidrum]|uniref:Uncharacterized protein n=2 Tax=Paracoccus siganidrum TaxID=1276757 RepID=A0A419A619_9RHOB|nr:hypothetical protein D3P05_11875 [Paracoccus siganidrum]RMC33421.1 hypothetical protein C9E82_13305 [Paracoccus siganidrum]
MLKITVEDQALQDSLRHLAERDIRVAATWALNDTASDVLQHVQDRMDEVFDRPTRFAKNAFTVRGARPTKLEAEVIERPSVGRRHFLKVQEFGGQRGQTGLEGLLSARLAYDGHIQAAVPAAGAKLDAYGNWSSGERNQALSAVQAQRDRTANTTDRSRRRNRKRAGFFVPREGSKLSPGIWKRNPDGSIQKILHFTTVAPVYEERLGFFDGAAEVYADRLPFHLKRTLAKMVSRRASGA